MKTFFRDRWDLNRANKALRDEERLCLLAVKNAKKAGKTKKEINEIYTEMNGVCQEYRFDVDVIESMRLIKLANKLNLPVPAFKDELMWEKDGRYRILSKKGKIHLKNLIRKENRERVDIFVKIASMIIGLLGAFAVLITILKS